MWQTRVRRIVTWSWKLQKTTVPNNKRMCRCSLDSRLCKVRLIGQDVMRHQMTIAQRTTSLLDKFQLITSVSCDPKVLLSFWMHICITSSANPLMHSVFYYHPATDVFCECLKTDSVTRSGRRFHTVGLVVVKAKWSTCWVGSHDTWSQLQSVDLMRSYAGELCV